VEPELTLNRLKSYSRRKLFGLYNWVLKEFTDRTGTKEFSR